MSEKGIWFTSDLHFNHKLGARIRGFGEDIEAMNEMIVSTWNQNVQKGHRVYVMGDVSLRNPERTRELLDRLNGQIYLVRGNHENVAEGPKCRSRFEWIKDVHMLKVKDEHGTFSWRGKVRIWLSHYAHRVWPQSHYGVIHLYGHSHGYLMDDQRVLAMDVGIDAMKMRIPVSYEWVLRRMTLKNWTRPEGRRDELEPFGE